MAARQGVKRTKIARNSNAKYKMKFSYIKHSYITSGGTKTSYSYQKSISKISNKSY